MPTRGRPWGRNSGRRGNGKARGRGIPDHIDCIILSGQGLFNKFLFKNGKAPSPLCEWCGDQEETIYYAVVVCPK